MLGVNHFLLCSGFMRAMMGIVDFELYYVISWCYEIFMGLFIHVLVPSICLFEAVPIIFKIKFVWFALEMVRQCFVLDEWISFSLWMAYEFENVRCWPKKKKKKEKKEIGAMETLKLGLGWWLPYSLIYPSIALWSTLHKRLLLIATAIIHGFPLFSYFV